MSRSLFSASIPLILLCLASGSNAQSVNPYDGDRSAMAVGATLFGARCSTCHGADAKGIVAPDLTALWVNGTDDRRAFDIIRSGVPGSVMPPSQAPDNEIWSIVAYLKSINIVARVEPTTGDPQRGQTLFATHCASCHRVQGEGGSLGPDLTRIAEVRSRDALIQSIRDPGAAVARAYRPVHLQLLDGSEVQGVLKSEDAFSVQIMDSQQQLRGFRTADLRRIDRPNGSLMPEFAEDTLSAAQMDDLLHFLATLIPALNDRPGAR